MPISHGVEQLRWLACKDSGHEDLLFFKQQHCKRGQLRSSWGRTRPRRTPLLSTHAAVPAAEATCTASAWRDTRRFFARLHRLDSVARLTPSASSSNCGAPKRNYRLFRWRIPLSKRWKEVDTVRQLATAAIGLFQVGLHANL